MYRKPNNWWSEAPLFIIIYKIKQDALSIARILHAARKWPELSLAKS